VDINTLTSNSVLSTSTLSISYTVKPAVTVTLELTASLKPSQQDLHVKVKPVLRGRLWDKEKVTL